MPSIKDLSSKNTALEKLLVFFRKHPFGDLITEILNSTNYNQEHKSSFATFTTIEEPLDTGIILVVMEAVARIVVTAIQNDGRRYDTKSIKTVAFKETLTAGTYTVQTVFGGDMGEDGSISISVQIMNSRGKTGAQATITLIGNESI